ncbi:MAG TPA: GFA family protein, partial [Stellaceae bacterium]|nr:GFA family protein [Stellaceae bacterium]
MTEMPGGCACGASRYRVTATPLIVHACHCRDCQRHTGSAFVINLWIERKFVEADYSPLKIFRLTAGSGQPHDIYCCPNCGIRLWSHYHASPGETLLLRAGTLDDPASITPDVHIFTRSKLPWVTLPPGARAFQAMYKLADVWTDESRARLRASIAEK